MRVISVYNRYLNRGGEDEVFESEAALLQQHGCDVTLVEERVKPPARLRDNISIGLKAIWSSDWYEKFAALLEDKQPQVVHIHNLVPVISPSVLYACRRANVPVVHTLHNYRLLCPAASFFRDGHLCEECVDHGLWRSVRYGCFQGSRSRTAGMATMLAVHRVLGTWAEAVDCYVALNEFARQKFIKGGLLAEKIVVKPHFVHPDPGKGTGDSKYALFVGRLWPPKGIETLMAAWERLATRVPLLLVGDGPLSQLVEVAHSRSQMITYRGRLPRDETIETIKKARFLLVPSECYEGFGLTIVEAFACGTPIICSRLGALQEIVEDGRTGLHFTAGDADDLAAKVNWAWTHPEQMSLMGRAARLEYEGKYTAERNYTMLLDIYQRAMRMHSNAAAVDVNSSSVSPFTFLS